MYAPASTLSFFPYTERPVVDPNWMLHDMICNYDFYRNAVFRLLCDVDSNGCNSVTSPSLLYMCI